MFANVSKVMGAFGFKVWPWSKVQCQTTYIFDVLLIRYNAQISVALLK